MNWGTVINTTNPTEEAFIRGIYNDDYLMYIGLKSASNY